MTPITKVSNAPISTFEHVSQGVIQGAKKGADAGVTFVAACIAIGVLDSMIESTQEREEHLPYATEPSLITPIIKTFVGYTLGSMLIGAVCGVAKCLFAKMELKNRSQQIALSGKNKITLCQPINLMSPKG